MAAEWWNKTENPVEKKGDPRHSYNGGLWPIPGVRVRQPLMAKEPLCGIQSANLSLVIAVFRFPSCFVVLPFEFWFFKEEVCIGNKY
jgi:hypothetical protein